LIYITPLSFYLVDIHEDVETIQIDEEFEDWNKVEKYKDSYDDQENNPNINLIDSRVVITQDDVISFYIEVYGNILNGLKINEPDSQGLDLIHLFIDSDSDSSSGYRIRNIGADYIVEIQGYDGRVGRSVLKMYTPEKNQNNWNGWEELNDLRIGISDGRLEGQVKLPALTRTTTPEFVVHLQDSAENEDYSDFIMAPTSNQGALRIDQNSISPEIIEDGEMNVPVLQLELTASNRDLNLGALTLHRTGTAADHDITSVRLIFDANNNREVDEGDTKISMNELVDGLVKFEPEMRLNIPAGQTLNLFAVVDVPEDTGLKFKTFGLKVCNDDDIKLNSKCTTSISSALRLSYLGERPDWIVIDGAFADWELIEGQPDLDPTEVENVNIDLKEYRITKTENGLALYFNVEGTMMGGTMVPVEPKLILNDRSRPAFTTPVKGSHKTIEELLPAPEIIGEDNAYVFLDTDLNSNTGFSVDGFLAGAEYMVRITGKNSEILTSNCYAFSGIGSEIINEVGQIDSATWIYIDTIPVAIDTKRMETEFGFDNLGLAANMISGINIYFYLENWINEKDTIPTPVELATHEVLTDNVPVLSYGKRAPTSSVSEIAHGYGKEAYDAFGWNVSYAGDLNSDGYDDFMASAPFNDSVNGWKEWWDTDWDYRMKLSFNNNGQTEDLMKFPVMVNLSAANFDFSRSKNDGSDLRFVDDDGATELKYHIEDWNTSNYSYVWVNVTNITGNSNTDHIWMYYGNSGASNVEDETGTYDDNFVGAWHLGEDMSGTGGSAVYKDSTSYNNDGNDYVAATGQMGKINGGQQFSGNGDNIQVPHSPELNITGPMTISFWIYPTSPTSVWNRIVEKGQWGYQTSYYFGCGDGTNDLTFYLSNNEVFDTANNILQVNSWQHAAVSYNSSGNATLFLNGVVTDSGSYTGSIQGNVGLLNISNSDTSYDFPGYIDEVRISNIARSDDWLKAQYLCMNNSFVNYGNEQVKDWWDSDWKYRKKLTFNNNGQSENLLDFPVMVKLDSANFDYSKTKSDGTDLRFIDEDGVCELKYQIETWNNTTSSYIWVKVTNITGSSSTDHIWIYYGNLSAPDVQDPVNVWDINYTQVLHLNESVVDDKSSGIFYDSTSNYFNGSQNGVDDIAGKIGKGQDFDGVNDYILTTGDEMNVSQYMGTVEAWVKVKDISTTLSIFQTEENRNRLLWTEYGEYKAGMYTSALTTEILSGGAVNSYWRYLTFSWDINQGRLNFCIDGVLVDSYSGSGWTTNVRTSPTRYGHNEIPGLSIPSRAYFKGTMDEIRVSDTVRTLDWVKAQYLSMNNEFIEYGSEDDYNEADHGAAYIFYGYQGIDLQYFNASNANVTINGSNPGDRFGWDIASAGDINNNGITDIMIGAPGVGNDKGRVYIFYGENLIDESAKGADLVLNGTSDNYQFGNSLNCLGDVNGDNIDDIAVGAYAGNKAYIFYGGAGVGVGSANITITGEVTSDCFGFSVAGAGDIDQDGFNDIIIGTPNYEANIGRAYIFHGDSSLSSAISANNANVTLSGEAPGDEFGFSLNSTGDLNADGYDDIIVGAPGYNNCQGRAYIYSGSPSMTSDPVSMIFTDSFETDLSKWDGNGVSSWYINETQYYDGSKSVRASNGNEGYLTSDDIDLSGTISATLDYWYRKSNTEYPDFTLYYFDGTSYNLVNELNDDGSDDTWLHCNNESIDLDIYRISNFRIRFDATLSSGEDVWVDALKLWVVQPAVSNFTITGSSAGDRLGFSVSGNGDVNQDGTPEIVIGAPYADYNGWTDCGIVYIFLGEGLSNTSANNANFTAFGSQSYAHFGRAVSFAGDIEFTPGYDILVGAPFEDNTVKSYTDAGAVYLFGEVLIPEFYNLAVPLIAVLGMIIFRIDRKTKLNNQFGKKGWKKGGGNFV
jgi:hypothetical protein